MNHLRLQFITKHILVVSYVLLVGCSYPPIEELTSQPTKKADNVLEPTKQQQDIAVSSRSLATACGEPAQLTLDNATTEVTEYLQRLQGILLEDRLRHPALYQATGKRLLQQIEALKKSQKKAYRMADRNFLYNSDISSGGMCLLQEEMKNYSQELKCLRDLRSRLLQTFHFSQKDILACNIKIKASQDRAEGYEIDSSDEEKLTYSRGELALRKGGWKGIQQGIVTFPSHFLASIQSMLLDKSSTSDKLTDYLLETPHVSEKVAEYVDSLEGNEEEKGKEIGEWITRQILLGVSEVCQANLIKHIGKAKLIKALLKVIRAKHQEATKKHKLTQKSLQELGRLANYQDQTAQEVLKLCKNSMLAPSIRQKNYWQKT